MAQKDLGMVTSYAYALSQGYTGTEEEFAEGVLASAEYADNAQASASAAAQSKTDAEAAASSVQASAQQIATNTADIADIKSDLSDMYVFSNISPTWVNGKYLDYSTGEEASNVSYSYFKTDIPDGVSAVHVVTTISSICGVCFYDNNNTFISGVRNSAGETPYDEVLAVPGNATKIGVSCLTSSKSTVSLETSVAEQITITNDELKKKIAFPVLLLRQQTAESQGIINTSLQIYNPSASYTGRYLSKHLSAGTTVVLTGYSVNTTYPAMVVAYDDNTTYSNYSMTNTLYTDRTFTMPKDGTIYINGSTTYLPVLKVYTAMEQTDIDESVKKVFYQKNPLLRMFYNNGELKVKKRISDTESVCVTFNHVGGNSLYNISYIAKVTETSGELMNDNFTSNGISINAEATDWFGPYIVQAVSNADGDVPEGNSYFTGGNHRSNNTATGGGVTAIETAFAITADGNVPTNGGIYDVQEIDIKWTNAVQGNNTSKSDGTGRAILNETWHVRITTDGIECENDIVPLEEIKLKTYYGLQVYFPSANVIYNGGTTRTPVGINSVSNSGNKTCKSAIIYTSNFNFEMGIEPVDLGLFENSDYSLFTTNASKLYAFFVGTQINCNANEHYYAKGYYKFW